MRLFSKIGYHSTSQKGLTQFRPVTDDEVAFTGEGAMVHGWGLYIQEDKELNLERYGQVLNFIPVITLTNKQTNESHTYRGKNKQKRYDGNDYVDENGNEVEGTLSKYLDDVTMHNVYSYNNNINITQARINEIKSGVREQRLIQLEKDKMWDNWRYYNEDFEYKSNIRKQFLKTEYDITTDEEFENLKNEIGLSNYQGAFKDYLYKNIFVLSDEQMKQIQYNLKRELEEYELNLKFYEEYMDYIRNYNHTYSQENETTSQYTVEIPDDMVFIEELDTIDFDNPIINEIITENMVVTSKDTLPYKEELLNVIYEEYPNVQYLQNIVDEYIVSGSSSAYDEFYNRNTLSDIGGTNARDMESAFDFISQTIYNSEFYNHARHSTESNKELYRDLSRNFGSAKKASEYLMSKGIDGIHYDGDADGYCWVIFNCNKLKIIKEE